MNAAFKSVNEANVRNVMMKECGNVNEECGNVKMWKCENAPGVVHDHFHIFTFSHLSHFHILHFITFITFALLSHKIN